MDDGCKLYVCINTLGFMNLNSTYYMISKVKMLYEGAGAIHSVAH